MEKYVSFGIREEVIECDIDITYEDFLGKIQETFNFKKRCFFSIIDLTETNFDEMMTIKDNFTIERSEKDLARERLGDRISFKGIDTIQEAKDFLLVYGFKLDKYGNSPLVIASLYGYCDIVKLILEYKFENAHRANNRGMTPLFHASGYGYAGIVKLLLEQNFDNAHEEGYKSFTPLKLATNEYHIGIVKLIEEDIARRKKEK